MITVAAVPVVVTLVANLATNSVRVDEWWWPWVIWPATGALVVTTVVIELRDRGQRVRPPIENVPDLTGTWEGNEPGGEYYVRQIGHVVWWVGLGYDYTNVFRGVITSHHVSGDWSDVPLGRTANWGSLRIAVRSKWELVRDEVAGAFTATQWQRTAWRAIRFPTVQATTDMGDTPLLTGIWATPDGTRYYLRQNGDIVWWFGLRVDGDRLRGEWADVPAGAARGAGRVAFDIAPGLGQLVLAHATGTFPMSPKAKLFRVGA